MNGAQAIVEMLQRYDTRVIFGLPGDTSVALYDALYAQTAIRHVMARDERTAAFMADAYARLSGKPGVCEGPSGGGATYMLPGVVEAHGSAIPLIALTSDNPLGYEAQGALTGLDQQAIYSSVTKWTALIKRADMLPHFVRRAFRLATSGRPGAVHLSLPKDVLAADLAAGADMHAEAACTTWPAYRTRPDAAAVERAARSLLQAEHPVVVAGGGAVSSLAFAELLALAEWLGAPVATTVNGKGAIAETSPLSLGVVGGNGGRRYANETVAGADLVLFVGSKVNYVDTDNWRLPLRSRPPVIIQVDVDSSQLGNTYPIAEGLCGDARLALADLLEALKSIGRAPRERGPWHAHIRQLRADWQAGVDQGAAVSGQPINPRRVIAELQKVATDETVFLCDPGTPTPYMAAEFIQRRAGRQVISPRAQGGLGYAIPAMVGARLARPGAPIIGLCGDGSFVMSSSDLVTLAREGGAGVLILFNNGSYGWIKALQKLYHGGRSFSVDFTEPMDYVQIAEGFGLRGVRVTDPAAIGPELRKALDDGGPYMIEVVTAAEDVATPPVAEWERLAGDEG